MNFIQRIVVFCVLPMIGSVAFAQQKHERYVQKLDGTSLAFSMEAIPGGRFRMGSAKSPHADEKPAHEVKIDPLWMSTFEVTWELYDPFVYKDFEVSHTKGGKVRTEVDAVTRPSKPYIDMTFGMGKDARPALGMTQYSAIQFCKWLYVRTGHFYRLPTEAEWEYACRAGSESEYPFGNDAERLGEYAWFAGNSGAKANKVGQKKPNAWGLYDMMGNVAEWTYDQYLADCYKPFGGKTADNPVVVPTKLYPRSVRGGSFQSKADDLRSASRMASDPKWKQLDPQIPKSKWWLTSAPFVGIRIVRPLAPPSRREIDAYYDRPPIKDF